MTAALPGGLAPHPAVGLLLMVAFFALAVEQALHVSRLMRWHAGTRGVRLYECMLFSLLLLGFCDAHGLAQGLDAYHDPTLRWLAWAACLAAIACGAALLLAGRAHGHARGPARSLGLLAELACAACLLPPVALALGAWWGWVVAACAAVLAARVTARVLDDKRRRVAQPARDAMAHAVQLLPAGVLCTGADGRVLFMNDAMRVRLAELGLPGDLADLGGVWEALEARARRGAGVDAILPEGLRLGVGAEQICLFTCGVSRMGGHACRWVAAVDVTERERVVAELAQATRALEEAGVELRASLADVDEVARNEALAAMRSRVHDVVGQRLSILHRYLEDGADEETFGQVAALIEGTAEELRGTGEPDAAAGLAGVVDAFALAGVEVRVEGGLPRDAGVAGLFVQVVRECATNAVRHGRARTVVVRMGCEGEAYGAGEPGCAPGGAGEGCAAERAVGETGGLAYEDARAADGAVGAACGAERAVGETGGLASEDARASAVPGAPAGRVAEAGVLWYTLAVSNDGLPCLGAPEPGGGLSGMRAACERLGAGLEVEPGPPFAVRVHVPRRAGESQSFDEGGKGGTA